MLTSKGQVLRQQRVRVLLEDCVNQLLHRQAVHSVQAEHMQVANTENVVFDSRFSLTI